MEPRTERLLRVVGSREGYAILRVLLGAETTTTALADATKLSVPAFERALEPLVQGSVVSRRSGMQGAWYLERWPETFAILDAARRLTVAIKGTEERIDNQEDELFAYLEMTGGAASAVKRGRRAQDQDG